ncbi:hypothetical protein C0992_005269, partial [Termitomyces sp. T32_za158]
PALTKGPSDILESLPSNQSPEPHNFSTNTKAIITAPNLNINPVPTYPQAAFTLKPPIASEHLTTNLVGVSKIPAALIMVPSLNGPMTALLGAENTDLGISKESDFNNFDFNEFDFGNVNMIDSDSDFLIPSFPSAEIAPYSVNQDIGEYHGNTAITLNLYPTDALGYPIVFLPPNAVPSQIAAVNPSLSPNPAIQDSQPLPTAAVDPQPPTLLKLATEVYQPVEDKKRKKRRNEVNVHDILPEGSKHPKVKSACTHQIDSM